MLAHLSEVSSITTRISLEDGGRVEVGSDNDFDDFVVEAGGFAPAICPPIQ